MADFTRLNRYRAELKRMRDKRIEVDNRIKVLEQKCREEENTTIRDIVHEARLSPEDLAVLIGMNGAERLAAINGANDTGILVDTNNMGTSVKDTGIADKTNDDKENDESEENSEDDEND